MVREYLAKLTMQLGMISCVVPLGRYPDTCNGQPFMLAALAIAVYEKSRIKAGRK